MRRADTQLRRVGGLIAVGLAAAACGGSSSGGPDAATSSGSPASDNGEAARPAARILRDARRAALAASSVHVKGSIVAGSGRIALDVSLVGSRRGRGRLSINGLGLQIVRIGSTAYLSGTQAFYRRLFGSAAAQLLEGRWLKASAGSDSQFASFGRLTDMRALLASVLASKGHPTSAGTTTSMGKRVVALEDATGAETLYVAAQGPPYPVAIVDRTRHAAVVFDRWGAPVPLAAPAGAIDLSSLGAFG
jgi:hypothetical protein